MKETVGIGLCRVLLERYEVSGWTVKSTRKAMRYLGCCDYRKKEIRLAAWIFEKLTDDEIIDTILHEIAHAKAGSGAGHGLQWQIEAIKIGAKPERYYRGPVNNYRWETYCLACGKGGRKTYKKRGYKALGKRYSPCCCAKLGQREIQE